MNEKLSVKQKDNVIKEPANTSVKNQLNRIWKSIVNYQNMIDLHYCDVLDGMGWDDYFSWS